MDQIRMAVIPHRRDVGSLVETPLGESYRRSLIFTPIAALGFSFCMQKYALYILYSQSLDIYYKGISHHPELRLKYHNSSSKGWTKRGRPWILVFCKYFNLIRLLSSSVKGFLSVETCFNEFSKYLSTESRWAILFCLSPFKPRYSDPFYQPSPTLRISSFNAGRFLYLSISRLIKSFDFLFTSSSFICFNNLSH